MTVSNVTIGADPELFIINERTNKVVSSIGLIPGEKGDPWTDESMPQGFGLETDNILAEFNIPPVQTKSAFINNINYMKNYINSFVKNINPDLGILCSASQEVDPDQLKSKEAKEFGCSVDYNVYTQKANPKPKGTTTNLRSAGMHIHCGYENPNIDTSLAIVKYMDAYLGVPSVIKDPDIKRRSLYGKAGCFRLTDYGVEYRCLSSYMMSNNDLLAFVWKQIEKAITAINHRYPLPRKIDIQKAINHSNSEIAERLIQEYNLI